MATISTENQKLREIIAVDSTDCRSVLNLIQRLKIFEQNTISLE